MFKKLKGLKNLPKAIKNWRTTVGGVIVGAAILLSEWIATGNLPDQGWSSAILAVILGAVAGDNYAPRALPVDPENDETPTP